MEAGLMVGDAAEVCLSGEALFARLADFPVVMLDALPTSRHPLKPRGLLAINARQLSSYGGSLETAVTDLEHYRNTGSAVLVLCGGEVRAKNLLRLLEERSIPAVLDLKGAAMPKPGELRITVGALSAGCEWPALKLAVLTEGQLTAPTQKKLKLKKDSNRQKLQSYTDLSPGDLVVHTHHGIGRFAGIQRMPVDGVEKDYIKIDYAGGDCLYVPVTQLDMVSKYIGGGEDQERTRLNKLGGTEWAKQKTKARKAAKDLAAGLTKLYAERQRRPGFAFSPDSPWQTEFEEAFPYAETGRPVTGHRRHQEGHGKAPAHGSPPLRRRGLRQDGGGAPGRYEMRPGRQAGGNFGAHHRSGPAALRHRLRPVQGLPGEDRGALPIHHRQGAEAHSGGCPHRRSGPADRHPQAACRKIWSSRIWGCWSSTRSSASA